MIIFVNRQTVLMDVSRLLAERLSRSLSVPREMVHLTWNHEDGKLNLAAGVELPPAIPPADMDVSDPAQMAQWEAEVAEMPSIHEFLRARGINNPDPIIRHCVETSMVDLKHRLDGLNRSAARVRS